MHKRRKSVAATCVLLAFCDWVTVPLYATREGLLDLKGKGNRLSVDFFLKLFYFKPVLFLGGSQTGAVLCKPYAVMPKQFLPSGTNSRFSHYCHNYDEGMGLGE